MAFGYLGKGYGYGAGLWDKDHDGRIFEWLVGQGPTRTSGTSSAPAASAPPMVMTGQYVDPAIQPSAVPVAPDSSSWTGPLIVIGVLVAGAGAAALAISKGKKRRKNPRRRRSRR